MPEAGYSSTEVAHQVVAVVLDIMHVVVISRMSEAEYSQVRID